MTCVQCDHADPHDGAGIGVCRFPGCGCEGPIDGQQVVLWSEPQRLNAIIESAVRGGCPELFTDNYEDFPTLIPLNVLAALRANGYRVVKLERVSSSAKPTYRIVEEP